MRKWPMKTEIGVANHLPNCSSSACRVPAQRPQAFERQGKGAARAAALGRAGRGLASVALPSWTHGNEERCPPSVATPRRRGRRAPPDRPIAKSHRPPRRPGGRRRRRRWRRRRSACSPISRWQSGRSVGPRVCTAIGALGPRTRKETWTHGVQSGLGVGCTETSTRGRRRERRRDPRERPVAVRWRL